MNAGDPCPNCKAFLNVVTTRIIEGTRKRYIGCRACGYAPEDNVRTVPLAQAPRQPQRHWQKSRTTVVRSIESTQIS